MLILSVPQTLAALRAIRDSIEDETADGALLLTSGFSDCDGIFL